MKMLSVNEKLQEVSAIALGCMRLTSLKSEKEVGRLIDFCMNEGINFFDHADIYADGDAERIFGEAMKGRKRQEMVLQTKCAIRPGCCYDSSKEYILKAVEGSLKRLGTDYIDILLLHRPDALMEPEEIAEAFRILKRDGKVRSFGVSNHNPMQIALLNSFLEEPVCVNQLQYSIAHCPTIDAGFNVNICNDAGCDRDGSIIEYCRINKIRLQAWSPFQYGMFEGIFIGSEKYSALNQVLDRMAEKYHVTQNAVAVAWIMRHPAGIQTIVGSVNQERIAGICKACEVSLSREEWYELYLAAGKILP